MSPITAGLMACRITSRKVKVKAEVRSSLCTAKRAHREVEEGFLSFLTLPKYESGQFSAPVANRVPIAQAKNYCVSHIQPNTTIFHPVVQ